MDRTLKKRAKQTEAYRAKHKRIVLLIIMWIVVSLVCGFTIFPVAGAIGLLLWPIVVLVSLLKSHFHLKNIVTKMEEEAPYEESAPQVNVRQKDSGTKQSQRNSDNPVVNAAASYAIGKAVTEKLKQSPLAKNPYTEKYKERQRELNQVLGQRVPLTKQNCYTCTYWCGQRQVVKQQWGKSYVQLPRSVAPAKCNKQFRTVGVMSSNCKDWTSVE